MYRYIVRRLLLVIPSVLLAGSLVFFMVRVLPGDVVTALTSEGGATEATKAKLREELGLNDPILVQYGRFLGDAVRGDLGFSNYQDRPVRDVVLDKLEATLTLAVFAMALSLAIALPLGILSAVKRGRWIDQVIRLITATGLAVPPFWLGILILLIASRTFEWSPPVLYASIVSDPVSNLKQMFLPALATGFASAAIISRLVRSMMLEVLNEDFVRTARAKGLAETTVVIRHALRNALIPVLTMSSYHFSFILAGVVVIEQVFNIPGLGRQILLSIDGRDFNMVVGIVLAFTIILAIWILIVDILYTFVDPRIRYT